MVPEQTVAEIRNNFCVLWSVCFTLHHPIFAVITFVSQSVSVQQCCDMDAANELPLPEKTPFCHVSFQPKGVNLYDMAGDSTWPIILVSYMYVKKDQTMTNPKTAAALKVGSNN